MSALTLMLLQRPPSPRAKQWHRTMLTITERLVVEYGTPSLGNFRDPVKEIFYIVLSAKTTERLYQQAHKRLWTDFPNLDAIANASTAAIRKCVAAAGLGRKRASQLKAIASRLRSDLGSRPAAKLRTLSPEDAYAYLRSLPGVGAKSALCVMMYSLNLDVFPVDVHVKRVFQRLGLARNDLRHYKAQEQLPSYVPNGLSKKLHVALVLHGRSICTARTPDCPNCPILAFCKTGRQFTNGND